MQAKGLKPLPHKSTTHKEQYAHIREEVGGRWQGGTVFARLERDGWFATAALCVTQDQFDRHKGRTVARRRYFGPASNVVLLQTAADQLPTFEQLRAVYLDACRQMLEK